MPRKIRWLQNLIGSSLTSSQWAKGAATSLGRRAHSRCRFRQIGTGGFKFSSARMVSTALETWFHRAKGNTPSRSVRLGVS